MNNRPSGTPAAEFDIDSTLVSGLLNDQHPDLAGLPLQAVGAGWDNAMFRLGEELAIRLPRRAAAASLIEHEQEWLPRIAGNLTLPVPVPLRTGEPGRGYPWRWSILPWLKGETAERSEPDRSQVSTLVRFLASLHIPAPADAPVNPARSVLLTDRAEGVEERMARLARKTDLITPRIREIWRDALDTPVDLPPTWIHGDLHPRNVLTAEGKFTGIIDWGDMAGGDPATDLASAWALFPDPDARQELLDRYPNLSEATLRRAKGWGINIGVVLLETGMIDNPAHALIGERILRRMAD